MNLITRFLDISHIDQTKVFPQILPTFSLAFGAFNFIHGTYCLQQEGVFAGIKEKTWRILKINNTKHQLPSHNPASSYVKIIRAATQVFLGLSFIAASIYLYSSMPNDSRKSEEDNLYKKLSSQNRFYSADKKLILDSKEEEAKQLFGQGILELNSTDLRPKLVFFAAQEDHNNALKMVNDEQCKIGNKILYNLGAGKLLEQLDKLYDIQYKVIKYPNEICKGIKQGAEIGDIKSVVINAHGDPGSITFSASGVLHLNDKGKLIGLKKDCFSGLSPDANVILASCLTGASSNGIVSAIAKFAQRTVWAPLGGISSGFTTFSSQIPSIPSFAQSELLNKSPANWK